MARENSVSGEGDRSQFAEIVRAYYRRITIVALAITGDLDTAEDIAQETFLRAWLKLDTLRDPALMLPWLNRIAANMARMWMRSGQTRSRLLPLLSLEELTMEPPDHTASSPRDAAAEKERNQQLSRAIMELPEDLRQVVVLHYAEGMSASEIARMSGEAPSTVTRRLDRARAQLRDQLESGMAMGLAALKPIGMQKTLGLIGAAAALPAVSRANLLRLASDTPPPPLVDPVITTAKSAAIKETGIMKSIIAKLSATKLVTALAAAGVVSGGIYAVNSFTSQNHVETPTTNVTTRGGAAQITALNSTKTDSRKASPQQNRAARNEREADEAVKNNRSRTLAAAAETTATTGQTESPDKVPVGHVTVTGTVYDAETSATLGDTLVLASSPAKDMRMIRKEKETTGIVSTRTDRSGAYELEVPLYDEVTSISLDAMTPGYGSLAGSYYRGGDFSKHGMTASPGQKLQVDLHLPRAAYVAGHVLDEAGNPVEHATVDGIIIADGTYTVDITLTDANGHFEILNYPAPPDALTTGSEWILNIQADDKESTMVSNLAGLSEEQRATLQITMRRGQTLSGQLLDASGAPLVQQGLFLEYPQSSERRRALTDASGRFRFQGLKPGPAKIAAKNWHTNQQLIQEIELPVTSDLTLRMQPAPDPDINGPVTLLGMSLIDMTPELAEAYNTYDTTGVLVLNYGPEAVRLGIIDEGYNAMMAREGSFGRGDVFWVVGNKRISNLKEFVAEVLRVNSFPEFAVNEGQQGAVCVQPGLQISFPEFAVNEGQQGFVRVVYTLNWFRASGTNTTHMKLTPTDAAELKQFYESRYGPLPEN